MSYYVTNENSVLNINNAHLKVSGNIQTDVMKLGAIEFAPPASDVPGTVNFTNVTTGVTTSSNLNVGGTLMLGSVAVVGTPPNTANLHDVVNLGNVTSNTIQFTNATTGIVATGNVEASKFIGDGSLLTGITAIESNVDLTTNTNNTAFINLNSNVVVEFPRSKNLTKYPKVAMTANSSGGYVVSASSALSGSWDPWKAFNTISGESEGWHDAGSTYSNGSYTAGNSITPVGGSPISGEYIQIQLPEKIKLERIRLVPRAHYDYRLPKDGTILGSINGTDWYVISSWTGKTYQTYNNPATINTRSNQYYDYFVLVAEALENQSGGASVNIGEWELYGIPEFDPESHGTDVVLKTKTNVPNTDWLEVYFDGKDYTANTDFDQVNEVLDKTGGGNHGTQNGGVGFDSAYKAFKFDGSNDYIEGTRPSSLQGNVPYTMALWIKYDSVPTNTYSGIVEFGDRATNTASGTFPSIFALHGPSYTNGFYFSNGANYSVSYVMPTKNKWYHLVGTYDGDKGHFYIDAGETFYGNGTSSATTNIPSTARVILGGDSTSGSGQYFNGSIANFRLFNRALTRDEIYQLYAFQKEEFGHTTNNMTLKAGRLGIGTSEPRAELDVRGKINGKLTTFLTYDHVVHSSTTFNSSPSWPTGQSLSIVNHTWDMPTEYAALGKATLNGYVYVSWSGSCPNPWQAVFWIDIYYNDEYMGRGSTTSGVQGNANHGNTTVALTNHSEENNASLDSANVTTGFKLRGCDVSLGSTIKIDLICQRGDYQSGENVVWTNRNHSAPSSNARDYEQGTTNFFVVLNVE